MLKAAGVDQFSIADRLRSLDAEHVAHLTRMYQRQATRVAQLVDELRWVEGFLVGSGWAQELDDELTARLPVPDDDVDSVLGTTPGIDQRADDPAERLQQTVGSNPVWPTALLAAVAMVRKGWVNTGEQLDLAHSALHHRDRRIADDAALAFGGWRMRFAPILGVSSHELISALIDCSYRDEAAVALRLLGQDDAVDRAFLGHPDPELAFGAALALVDLPLLTTSLLDPSRRRAASMVLAAAGHGAHLAPVICELDDDTLEEVLGLLRRRDVAFPMLHEQLWELVRRGSGRVRSLAAVLLVTIGRPEDAIALLRISPTDTSAVQDVIQRMVLRDADVLEACCFLVDEQRFTISQYGVSDLAVNGRLPEDFVPNMWVRVRTDERRVDLLRFAEEQLYARSNEKLHHFVLNIVFAERNAVSVSVRAQAWWCLLRWYGRIEHASKGPLVFNVDIIDRYFTGGFAVFVDRFLAVLHDPATPEELTLEECLGNLLRYSPEEGLPGIVAEATSFGRLVEGLLVVLGDPHRRLSLRSDIVRFLENIVRSNRSMLQPILTVLAPFEHEDMEFEISTTISRLRGD